MSIATQIIAAARTLKSSFTQSDLVVACWDLDHYLFGLEGYADLYPDNNKIVAALSGKRGLVARGLLKRAGKKMYRIGEVKKTDTPPAPVVRFTVGQIALVERCLHGMVAQKLDAGKRGEVKYSEACLFWNLSETRNGYPESWAYFHDTLTEIAAMYQAGAEMVLDSGRAILPEDVRVIQHTHEWLKDRFRAQLKVMGVKAA